MGFTTGGTIVLVGKASNVGIGPSATESYPNHKAFESGDHIFRTFQRNRSRTSSSLTQTYLTDLPPLLEPATTAGKEALKATLPVKRMFTSHGGMNAHGGDEQI
jgi:hypothetical protein